MGSRRTDDTVKCWGGNYNGSLGYGDQRSRGMNAFEMGDALPPVNLGTAPRPARVIAGGTHTCVVFVDGRAKCWGANSLGQLGIGTTVDMGDNDNEMGDNLPFVKVP